MVFLQAIFKEQNSKAKSWLPEYISYAFLFCLLSGHLTVSQQVKINLINLIVRPQHAYSVMAAVCVTCYEAVSQGVGFITNHQKFMEGIHINTLHFNTFLQTDVLNFNKRLCHNHDHCVVK